MGNPSFVVVKGAQPGLGIPPASFGDFQEVTEVSNFTELPSNDVDDSIGTALLRRAPRRGKITNDPEEKHLISSIRNWRLYANALGQVEEGNRSKITILVNGFAGDMLGSVTRVRVNTAWNTTATTTLTEGVDWNVGGTAPLTATALATAINAISGVAASASSATVTVTRDPDTLWFDVHSDFGTDGTITTFGASFHRARGSAARRYKRYISAVWSEDGYPTTHLNVEPYGFTIEGNDNFMRGSLPLGGTRACGAQFFPTWTPSSGTNRVYVVGRPNDKDQAALAYQINIETGGEIPAEAGTPVVYLQSRLTGEVAYSTKRRLELNRPWPIVKMDGSPTGLHIVFPRGATTIKINTPSGLGTDTVTVTVTTAAGSTATILTEGTHWYALNRTAAQTAASLRDAINANVDGVTADLNAAGTTVHVHRRLTNAGNKVTGITLASSGGADVTLVTETAANTLTTSDVLTVSTRDTEPTPSVVSDTRWQFNSLEMTVVTIDGAAWPVRPTSMSLAYKRGLQEDDFVAADNARQDHPQIDHASIELTVTVREDDHQWINLMAGDVNITGAVFRFEGAEIGTSDEFEMFQITLGAGKIMPFSKSKKEPFRNEITFTFMVEDQGNGLNEWLDLQWVNAHEYVGVGIAA